MKIHTFLEVSRQTWLNAEIQLSPVPPQQHISDILKLLTTYGLAKKVESIQMLNPMRVELLMTLGKQFLKIYFPFS